MKSSLCIVWGIEDVQEIAPFLNEVECSQVLTYCEDTHRADIGINWEVLRDAVYTLFKHKCTKDYNEMY